VVVQVSGSGLVAAVASALTGKKKAGDQESLGSELAAVAGEGGFEPSELVVPDMVHDHTDRAGS